MAFFTRIETVTIPVLDPETKDQLARELDRAEHYHDNPDQIFLKTLENRINNYRLLPGWERTLEARIKECILAVIVEEVNSL